MKRGNKKGLAEIITVILIILLSLAAIAIIWQVIKPVILKTTSQISLVCLNMDLKITQTNCSREGEIWSVRLERGVGEGEIKTLKFVFSGDSGSETITWTKFTENADGVAPGMPDELDVVTYTFDLNEYELPSDTNEIKIAPVVEAEGGEELSCPVIGTQECSV